MLAARGLKAVAGHFSYARFKKIRRESPVAKIFGMQYAGCPWIHHTGTFDEKQCREAAAVFNHAGEVLDSHGIKFYSTPTATNFNRMRMARSLICSCTKPIPNT